MKALAKSFEPSSTAPAFDGPITGMAAVRGSALKSSYMPFTSGSSGPTTTMSTAFATAKSFSLSNSFTPMATFSPQPVVPALPGAMYSLSTLGLWAIFHARACSRPPLPNSSMFIVSVLVLGLLLSCVCTCCWWGFVRPYLTIDFSMPPLLPLLIMYMPFGRPCRAPDLSTSRRTIVPPMV